MAVFFLFLLKLTALAAALPFQEEPLHNIPPITEDMLVSIAPNSSSCAGAQFPDQCMTAQEVAALDLKAISEKWGLYSKGEFAGALAMMASQSNEFKINRDSTRATYNMQDSEFNWMYAQAIVEQNDVRDRAFTATFQALNQTHRSDEATATLVTLLNRDKRHALGAAFWAIGRFDMASADRAPLFFGDSGGFLGFLEVQVIHGRVDGDATKDQRNAYWVKACAALHGCTPPASYGG